MVRKPLFPLLAVSPAGALGGTGSPGHARMRMENVFSRTQGGGSVAGGNTKALGIVQFANRPVN
jgi:hypothetical protein